MAYVAHLADPTHGEVYEVGNTKEEAVNKAWKRFALNWCAEPGDFDGEIRENGEIWWYNRENAMIGVVREIDW